MALTNYSELVAATKNWLARDDLNTYVADFITIGELRLNRKVRLRGLETALSLTISSGVITVPTDYLELKSAYVNSSPTTKLERTTVTKLYAKYPDRTANNIPRFIAREGASFIFGPYPDSNYTIKGVYYVKPTALTSDNATNWYLTNIPDLFLYAVIIEACNFTEDEENRMKYESLFNRVLTELMDEEEKEEFSGSELRSWPG